VRLRPIVSLLCSIITVCKNLWHTIWSHYTCSARPEFFNRRKVTRAITNDRATPLANVICGVIQGPRLARSTMFLYQSFSEQETFLASQVADDANGCMERGWDLAQAIKQLPAKQQNVIILHYYQGMTLPEISRRSQVSENTLKKRLQAALSNLRRVLWEAEGDETTLLPGPHNQAAGDVSREHHTGNAIAPTKYSSAT
jgi:RNA polymerase sigma factor (sigma-70 family)